MTKGLVFGFFPRSSEIWMVVRGAALLVSALMATGCAFHQSPHKMYEGEVPIEQTSVFTSIDRKSENLTEARVVQVNGIAAPSFQAGFPYWVRVKPGTNTFTVRVQGNFHIFGGAIFVERTELNLTVKDMKPTHVYAAHYEVVDGKIIATIDDLGSRPDFGITLGLKGVNQNNYKVKFD